jgi:hypothetical protein
VVNLRPNEKVWNAENDYITLCVVTKEKGSFFLASPQKGAKTRVFEPACGRENARKSKAPPHNPARTSLDFRASPRVVCKDI